MTPIEALKKILEVTEDCKRLPRIEQIRDIATAALKEAEFAVEVKIPETNKDGSCNHACPLWECSNYGCFLSLSICKNLTEDWKPGKQCPQYKEEGK